jgi:hypothetical protein
VTHERATDGQLDRHFVLIGLRERIERGSPLAAEEWEFLERLLDKLELALLVETGLPEWLT